MVLNQTEWDKWKKLVENGYEARHDGKRNELIPHWWQAWEQFQKIMAEEDKKNSLSVLMEKLDYRYPVDSWLLDLEMELSNEKEQAKRREYCQKVLEILDWTTEDNSNFLGAIGETFYAEGRTEEGKAWFEECLAKAPHNANLLSIYSWCIEKQEGMQAAFELIRGEIETMPCTKETCGLFENAQYMAKQLGLMDEFNRIEEKLEKFEEEMEKIQYENMVHDDYTMQLNTPVVKEKKIYPNDPCPCGSGKKYKKCCGKNK